MYNFDLVIDKYERKWPALQDVQSVVVSGICLVAKNKKYGGFYYSKYIKNKRGNFLYGAGSHNWPILYTNGKVILKVKDFPVEPIITLTEHQQYVSIQNIQLTKQN